MMRREDVPDDGQRVQWPVPLGRLLDGTYEENAARYVDDGTVEVWRVQYELGKIRAFTVEQEQQQEPRVNWRV